MVAKFVVGVDGSAASGRALVWATRLAARRSAVVEPVLTWHFPPMSPTVLGDALAMPPFDDLEGAAHAQLDSLLESTQRLCDPGATLAEGRVLQGAAGPVLCDAAEDADLLVIGSRGYGGFKGLILGSVSAHCANAAPGPVAVIPHDWEPDGARGSSSSVSTGHPTRTPQLPGPTTGRPPRPPSAWFTPGAIRLVTTPRRLPTTRSSSKKAPTNCSTRPPHSSRITNPRRCVCVATAGISSPNKQPAPTCS